MKNCFIRRAELKPFMNKLLRVFFEIIFWIAVFSSPFLISIAIAVTIFLNAPELLWIPIAVSILGIVIGVFVAELVRRKYGCTRFMSRLIPMPGMWSADTLNGKPKAERFDQNKKEGSE